MEKEIWVRLNQKTKPEYEISNFGSLRRAKDGFILKAPPNHCGYKIVSINIDGERTTTSIHRLVALNFIPNPENKSDVNHIDGNKLNNHYSNLEWVTKKENTKHAFENKLIGTERIVLDTETGVYYESISDLANTHSIHRRTAAARLRCGHIWGKRFI